VNYFIWEITKNEDEKKIALKAENFDSDVIFKIDVYNQWNESGNLNSLENVNVIF
jgi:hypothetical protein